MADDRKIVIEIVGTGGKPNTPKPTPTDPGGDITITDVKNWIIHPINSLEENTVGRNIFLNQAYQAAKAAVVNTVQYSINRHFELTENYIAQEDMNDALSAIHQIAGIAQTAVASAFAGGIYGGAIGAVAGFTIGLAGSLVNKSIQAAQAKDRENIQLATANKQNSFKMARLGLNNGGRSTEN